MSFWSTSNQLIETKPKLGFWVLSSVYGIASTFFFAHFYSLGFSHSFPTLFFFTLLIGPFLGASFLTLDAYLLQFLSPIPFSRCRSILATSKVFYLVTLAAWLLFFVQSPTTAFLYVSSEGSSLCVALLTFSVYLSSFFLLVQTLKSVQLTSPLRALAQAIIISILSFSVICISMFILRFIYISIFSLIN